MPAAGAVGYRRLMPGALGLSVLAVAALLVVARLRGGEDLRESLGSLDPLALAAGLGLHVSAHLFWAFRMALLAAPSGVPLGWLGAWRLITAGVFGGAVTPGRIGGEALKLTILVRRGTGAATASRLLLLDRSIDLAFFAVMGGVAVALLPPVFGADGGALWFAALGAVMLLLFIVLLAWVLWRPGPAARAAHRLVGALARVVRRTGPDVAGQGEAFVVEVRDGLLRTVRTHPWRTAVAFLLTAANWVAEYAVLWTLLRGFGYEVPFWVVFLVGTVITMVSNIPLTPGGAAVAELSAYALIAPLAPGLTVLFPALWRSVTYLYDVAVGGVVAAAAVPGLLTRREGPPAPAGSPGEGRDAP